MFNNDNRTLILALGTRTVCGIRNDIRSLYPGNLCPLGCGEIDKIENILTCRILQKYHTSKEITHLNVKYEDIFSDDLSRQQNVAELYNQLLEIRGRILQGMPVAFNTGPVHGRQAVQRPAILSM